jgi:soluble lytic murein transglycosylase-like protein
VRSLPRGTLAAALLLTVVALPAAAGADPWQTGRRLFLAGRYEAAAEQFRLVLARRPHDRAAWLWYGAARLHQGEALAALSALRFARGPGPLEADAWLWTGLGYERLGDRAAAADAFQRAIRAAPTSPAAYWAGRRLRGEEDLPPAGAPWDPTDPAGYARLALRHNRRLSAAEAWRIGRALVAYGRRFDVDPRLVSALVVVESGFQPRAVSPAGALGLGQLMPDVARAAGVRDPFSIEDNLYGTVRVLRGHLERFGYHNLPLALAAYNAGSGAVRRYEGIPPYHETRWYVFHVTRLYLRYRGEPTAP